MLKSILTTLMVLLLLTPLAQASDGKFAPCSATDLETLQELESGYDALLLQGTRTRSATLLRYLVERQYEWRLGLNDELPRCAEAFEIGWLMSQVSGDAVAVAVLNLAEEDNSRILAPMAEGQSQVAMLLEELTAALDGATVALQSLDDVGAACSDAQMAILAPDTLVSFQVTGATALAITNLHELDGYADMYFAWRESTWDALPHCTEAVEFGLMMNQILGDFVAQYLHHFNVATAEDNPVKSQIESELVRFAVKMDEVVTALDRNRTVKIYYVTVRGGANIRACPTTECEILTVYEKGKEMRIIEDEGEWYEIRFDNGETGFIAGFLASMDPPS